jgi:hypothetical protein
MSVHTLALSPAVAQETSDRLVDALILIYGGIPRRRSYDGTTLTLEFAVTIPQADGSLSRIERDTIETDLAALRTFRQQTQAEFIALTQNQRDRALFDVVNAQTNVIRALLRDTP